MPFGRWFQLGTAACRIVENNGPYPPGPGRTIFLPLAQVPERSEMKYLLRLAAFACLTGFPLIGGLFAQGGPPVGGPPPCWPPPCIPVDGGISLLIGAGVLLGAKRSYDLHKRSKQTA